MVTEYRLKWMRCRNWQHVISLPVQIFFCPISIKSVVYLGLFWRTLNFFLNAKYLHQYLSFRITDWEDPANNSLTEHPSTRAMEFISSHLGLIRLWMILESLFSSIPASLPMWYCLIPELRIFVFRLRSIGLLSSMAVFAPVLYCEIKKARIPISKGYEPHSIQ